MKPKYALLSLSLSAVLATSPLFANTVVYVSESKDKRIAVFSLDEESGDLARVGQIDLDGAPGCLAISSDQKHLYASVRSTPSFDTLSVDPESGTLTSAGSAAAPGSAAYIFPDKTGRWLLAACYGEGLVSSSRIENSIVSGEPVSVLDVGKKAHCIQTDPSNRFAFAPHPMDLNRTDQFAFDVETGKLALNAPPFAEGAEGAGPRHLQFHPNGKWVYVVNEQGKSVTHCNYDAAKGTLTNRKTLSTHPADWDQQSGSCADIEISADGKFLYASNRGHDSIAVFSIDPDSGELTAHGQTPTEKTPRSFNLIPGGEKFLVAAGQGSNTLIVYRRDSETGALTPLKKYDCGGGPAWVVGVKPK